MTPELSDIEKRLEDGEVPPSKRICDALTLIGAARKQGGEIAYITQSEIRFLSVAGNLICTARELVRIMETPLEKLIPASSPIMITAKAALNVLDRGTQRVASSPPKRTWRCWKCGKVETVSAVYDAKICMACNEPMAPVEASSAPSPAASSPQPAASSARSQPLAQTMQKLRDLSQAMLGVLDCKNPDGTARGEALAAWIELRETLDVLWLDPPLDGRDLDSSCGD